MKSMIVSVLGASLFVLPAITGCDREVSHERTVEQKSDGTVKKDETTVTQKPDGTIVKEKQSSTDRP